MGFVFKFGRSVVSKLTVKTHSVIEIRNKSNRNIVSTNNRQVVDYDISKLNSIRILIGTNCENKIQAAVNVYLFAVIYPVVDSN